MDNVENFFQKKLKESLESYRIPYDQNAWEKLSNNLDNQSGAKKNLLTRLFWIFLLLPLLAWNIHLQHKINIIESSKTDVVISPKTSIKVDTIIKYVDKIIYQKKPIYIHEKTISEKELFENDLVQKTTKNEDLVTISNGIENDNQLNQNITDLHNSLIDNNNTYDKMICDDLEKIKADYKIKLLASKDNLINNIETNDYPMNPAKKIKKLRSDKTNEISIGMLQSLNTDKINDQTFQISYNRTLWINFKASIGLQYSNSSMAVTHHEVNNDYAIPAPHQFGDNLTSINYHYRSIGIPIQLTYNLLSKKKVNPYLQIGVQFQKKMCCDFDYYFVTHSSEGYTINKLATLNNWNSFFQFGIGTDFPLYQKIKGFGAFQLKNAFDTKKLFNSENKVAQFLLGIKFNI